MHNDTTVATDFTNEREYFRAVTLSVAGTTGQPPQMSEASRFHFGTQSLVTNMTDMIC